jgi:hypothetical protein
MERWLAVECDDHMPEMAEISRAAVSLCDGQQDHPERACPGGNELK